MTFSVTNALHGARTFTKNGKDVVGLSFIKDSKTSYQLSGFIRSLDGKYAAHTWTIEGKYQAGGAQSESDLVSEWVGFPWYDISIQPSDMDGVTEWIDGDDKNTHVIYRFCDQKIHKTWQGTWEERGTATHWQNPGPTPYHLGLQVDSWEKLVRHDEILQEDDFMIHDGKWTQLKQVPWAKTRIGTKNTGALGTIVRVPDEMPNAQ